MKQTEPEEPKLFTGSTLVLALIIFGMMAIMLYPSLSENFRQAEVFNTAFTNTYDVDRTVESKYGFNVYLHDNTKLACDKPTLQQIESRASLKCTNEIKDNAVITLEPKKP